MKRAGGTALPGTDPSITSNLVIPGDSPGKTDPQLRQNTGQLLALAKAPSIKTATRSCAWARRSAAAMTSPGRSSTVGGSRPDNSRITPVGIHPASILITSARDLWREQRRAWLYQKRASHCPAGHAMMPANTYRRPGRKFRECRKCRSQSACRYWPTRKISGRDLASEPSPGQLSRSPAMPDMQCGHRHP
jgi:hypothetical protein